MALDHTELSPRKLAVRFTGTKSYIMYRLMHSCIHGVVPQLVGSDYPERKNYSPGESKGWIG